MESNKNIYDSRFQGWVVGYVSTLVRQHIWFVSDCDIRVGDVVLFTKSDKAFEKIYQYGIVLTTFESKDGLTRVVEVQYQNSNETVKRTTKRCVRELVIVHPVDEIGIQEEFCQICCISRFSILSMVFSKFLALVIISIILLSY